VGNGACAGFCMVMMTLAPLPTRYSAEKRVGKGTDRFRFHFDLRARCLCPPYRSFASRGAQRALALDDLGGEPQVRLAADTFQIVEQHGLAV